MRAVLDWELTQAGDPVAANALAIVQRAVAAGPPPEITDPTDPDQLARNVATKLAVGNPRYCG